MYRSLCTVLVLFVVSGSTFSWGPSKEEHHIMAECRKSYGKIRELSQDMNSAETIDNLPGLNELHSLECFTACYMEKLKWYDDDGALRGAVIVQALTDFENAGEVVRRLEECSFLPSDDCKKKVKSYECMNDVVFDAARKKKQL